MQRWSGMDSTIRGLPLSKAGMVTSATQCHIYQLQSPMMNPDMVPSPAVSSQRHGGRLIMCTHSAYGFAFPASNASTKTTICGLTECLVTIMVFYAVLLLTKELIHRHRSATAGPPPCDPLVLSCSPPFEVAGLVEHCLPPKDTVTVSIRW